MCIRDRSIEDAATSPVQYADEAVARARRALDEFVIEGIATTIPFHQRVLENEAFLAGEATTDFIETQMGDVL